MYSIRHIIMSVDNLLRKAREELLKLKLSSEKIDEWKQTQSKSIIENATTIADKVLKELVAETVGESPELLFDDVLSSSGFVYIELKTNEGIELKTNEGIELKTNEGIELKTNEGIELKTDKKTKKYVMQLQLVDKEYVLDLKDLKDNEEVKKRMVFLLNCVKVLYCPIKDHMTVWAKDNNREFDYTLQLDKNTNLYLDENSEKRIGITLKRVKKAP
jgi:hypothetical protein